MRLKQRRKKITTFCNPQTHSRPGQIDCSKKCTALHFLAMSTVSLKVAEIPNRKNLTTSVRVISKLPIDSKNGVLVKKLVPALRGRLAEADFRQLKQLGFSVIAPKSAKSHNKSD